MMIIQGIPFKRSKKEDDETAAAFFTAIAAGEKPITPVPQHCCNVIGGLSLEGRTSSKGRD
jgi:hypothetical protein